MWSVRPLPASPTRRGNEAPPAIMSAFIGSQLSSFLDGLEGASRRASSRLRQDGPQVGDWRIPEVLLDNTDRNRTSPFAFTGKFELRAAGSTNCAVPMTSTPLWPSN